MQREGSRRDGSGNRIHHRQRHSSSSKVGNRDNSLNRNRISLKNDTSGEAEQVNKGEISDKERGKLTNSQRDDSGVLVNSGIIHRSSSVDKNVRKSVIRNLSNDRNRRQESPRNGETGRRVQDSPRRNISSERSRRSKDSPRNMSSERTKRGNDSPRNVSSERTRRGKESPRNVSGERNRRANVSKGLESPRRTVMVQKAPKGIDTSLALGDLDMSDNDDDENDYDDNEAVSPRKRSPRKEFGLGHLQTTQSFEAKTSLIRGRDSDESLAKLGQRHSDVFRNDALSKPFIKKSLSNPAKIEFVRKHSVDGDDNVNDDTEQKPILDKSLHRTSSGRKLPTPNEHLRSSNRSLRKSTSDITENSKSDISENSAFDKNDKKTSGISGHKCIDKDGSKTQNEGTLIQNKSSQTSTYKTVDFNDTKNASAPDFNASKAVTDVNDTKNVPPSPREKKGTVRRSMSLEINDSVRMSDNVAETTVISKKPPSPRDAKPTKPQLERKISARSASATGVPASPRGTTVPSPRNSKPPSPRRSKPPSPRNVSRTTVPSPRGSSVPSPRGSLVRKSSLERMPSSDKVLPRRNSSSNLDSHSKESVKRTSSAPTGNFKSPRSISPVKSGKRITLKIDDLGVNGIDNCVDLDSLLPKVPSLSSIAKDENDEQVRI